MDEIVMTDTAHSQRGHAKLAPSSADRWTHCPGSIAKSAGMESKSSVFAKEGTAAHELLAFRLAGPYPMHRVGDDYIGWIVDIEEGKVLRDDTIKPDNDRYWAVDQAMVDATDVHIAEVQKRFKSAKDDELEVEKALDMSRIHPDLWGTADTILYRGRQKSLHVMDFKYGTGVVVDAVGNKQLLTYLAGAMLHYHNYDIQSLEIVIVQPRTTSGPGVKTWDVPYATMKEFVAELKVATAATDKPDAPLHAGPWCRWCPAAPTCEENEAQALRTAESEFEAVDISEPAKPAAFDADKVGARLDKIAHLKAYIKSLESYAYEQALAGNTPSGWKLVRGRSTRKWKNEGDAAAMLDALGYDKDEILTEPSLKSPAQIEKMLGAKNKANIKALVYKPEGGTMLAPQDDPRSPVEAGAEAEFDDASDPD